jgi:hypothetical protein
MKQYFTIVLACFTLAAAAQQKAGPIITAQPKYVSKVWVADQSNGTYKNPILDADYSDPDAIRIAVRLNQWVRSRNQDMIEIIGYEK